MEMIKHGEISTEYKYTKEEEDLVKKDIREPNFRGVVLVRWMKRQGIMEDIDEEMINGMENVVDMFWKEHYSSTP